MEVHITQTRICKCGREVISMAGVCGLCAKEGAGLFWAYMAGKITFDHYMSRIKIKITKQV